MKSNRYRNPNEVKASQKRRKKQRGYVLLTTFGVLGLLSFAAVAYIDRATFTYRQSTRSKEDVQTTSLCDAGIQNILLNMWKPFKMSQRFDDIDAACALATPTNPLGGIRGEVDGVGKFAAAVIGYEAPPSNTYVRFIKVRAVGWIDYDDDDQIDAGEPAKTIDVQAEFDLTRSQVFDYTYFINNYGWMYGFGPNDLIVNGDMRANANFDFNGGAPTINGSIVASDNLKLTPAADGYINQAPVKWSDTGYTLSNVAAPNAGRIRQAYNPLIHGAVGSTEFEKWRDFVFKSDSQIVNNRVFGSSLMDVSGVRSWQRLTSGATPSYSVVDTSPTHEIVMPDLSDMTYYQQQSQNYVDDKATYGDGSPNPGYGEEAYVEVWTGTEYTRLSVDGVVNGSAVLVGTMGKPIRIHGPITVTQDVVIKGVIEGQGTLYTGRNTHIVGSLRYKNGPDFRGVNPESIDNQNEKKDFLGIAARGSVMMGNSTTFANPYPLKYMTPPFTKGRYDDLGNWIPPFDAMQIDGTGRRRYQSVVPDAIVGGLSEGVNQVDAILYTNFVGGGNVGTSGGGFQLNGSIIAKDEAIVTWSLPVRMNYDNRIRERSLNQEPLIDLVLPRSPRLFKSAWQDRGFSKETH